MIRLDGLGKVNINTIDIYGEIAIIDVLFLDGVSATVNYRKNEKKPLLIDVLQTSIIGDQKQLMIQIIEDYEDEIFEHVTRAFKEYKKQPCD